MNIIRTKVIQCPCCMQKHAIKVVEMEETNIYRGKYVTYGVTYQYCGNAKEYFATESMLSQNHDSMKAAYDAMVSSK